MLRVGQQREVQILFGDKSRMTFQAVGADTQNCHSAQGQACEIIAKTAGFGGAAWGAVLGVEIEDERSALEVFR